MCMKKAINDTIIMQNVFNIKQETISQKVPLACQGQKMIKISAVDVQNSTRLFRMCVSQLQTLQTLIKIEGMMLYLLQ